nr:unnamed protein product [Callosobruchus analis]
MDTMHAEMKTWLNDALVEDNFERFEVKLTGEAERGEGFMGQVIFVIVEGVTKEGKSKRLDLVVKVSKDNETFRESIGKMVFEREMHMYEDVFVTFAALQKQNQVLVIMPTFEKKEILILEDLRPLGYELHDKKVCLNIDHTRVVLQEYAKLHALSFALKDQNKVMFDKLAGSSEDLLLDFLSKASTKRNINKTIKSVLTSLKERGDVHLHEKFEEITKGGADKVVKIFQTIDEQAVMLHGDCWNNNFMFRYKVGYAM